MTTLTVYAGARATTPAAVDALTWDAFCDEIAALCREETSATDKRDLVAFGPYRLRDGATRAAANVVAMSDVAAIDVDRDVDLAALRERIHELGVAAIVHGSPSDNASSTARKVRVYVKLDAEHAPSDAWRVRAGVAAMLGVTCDPSTSNADRVFFCGRLAGTPARYVERFEGKPVAVAALPAVERPAPSTAPPAPRDDTARDVAIDAAGAAVLGALGPWSDYDGRKHALCGALGGMLRRSGWPREACAAVIRAWLPDGVPGVNVEHGVRWACAAWDRDAGEVSGRAALDAIVGQRAGAVIEAAALLPWKLGAARDTVRTPDAPYATLRIVDLTTPPPPPDYVVAGLDLAPGKVSAIQGYANAGKTPFALMLATCVAAGLPVFGHACAQRGVAYFDHEASPLTVERAYRIRVGLGLAAPPPALTLCEAEPFSEALLDDARRLIADRGVGVIVVDTYSSALPADAGFNEASFRTWATELGRLSNATGVLVVLLVHDGKEAGRGLRGISGSGLLAGALQTSIALEPDGADANTVTCRCTRAARRGFAPFRVRWSDRDDGALVAAVLAASDAGATDAARVASSTADARARQATALAAVRIMRDIGERWTGAAALARRCGEGRAAADRALARLVDAGLLEFRADSYGRTPAGREADETAIRAAVGAAAGFTR